MKSMLSGRINKLSALEKFIYLTYIFFLFLLLLFTYTQIDLGLTFSRIDVLRNLIKSFQYVGYFNRPLSAGIYVFFVISLHLFYILFLRLSSKGHLDINKTWALIIPTGLILLFSYNAYSYDLFNYIFDAKIITHYHQNPYLHKALDFPGDPMLSFLHWTHRTYPYGPVWITLTSVFSYIGFNLFLPTFFLFKAIMAFSYLGASYYLGKIIKKIMPGRESIGLIFFALNPLVIIECLISAHLDIVMIFFAVLSLYKLLNRNYYSSFFFLIISSGIKFITGGLLPVYLIILYCQKFRKKINFNKIFFVAFLIMVGATVYASIRTNFQPWYLLEPFFILVLIDESYILKISSVIIGFFALLNYVPYLYLGNWNPPVPQILNNLLAGSLVVSALVMLFLLYLRRNIPHL